MDTDAQARRLLAGVDPELGRLIGNPRRHITVDYMVQQLVGRIYAAMRSWEEARSMAKRKTLDIEHLGNEMLGVSVAEQGTASSLV